MNVFLEIYYVGWESKIIRKGNFNVDRRKFEENNDLVAAEIAINWIREIKKEGNISRILKVKYNGDKDITELVKHS